MLSPFISLSECDPLGWECRAKKAADVAVAAAKDAIAQAAAEEEPEGDEEEMIDVAAATDAPSMEEVIPSHRSSILHIIIICRHSCTALSQPWRCNVQEAAQVAAVAEEAEEAAAAARPVSKKAKKRAAKEAAAKAQAEGAPSTRPSGHTFSLLRGTVLRHELAAPARCALLRDMRLYSWACELW